MTKAGAELWMRVRLTVGVKHVAGEPHLGRTEGIIGGEAEDGREHSAFETRVFRTPETQTHLKQCDHTTPNTSSS